MTKPIASDNFSTHPVAKERNIDNRSQGQQPSPDAAAHAAPRPDGQPDVHRAQQLLLQETEQAREPAITNSEQARERIAQLKAQIAADPQMASRAQGRIDKDFFEAAVARPVA